jgi:hypothetical protein
MAISTLKKTTIIKNQNTMAFFMFLILNLFWRRPRNISCFKKGKNLNFNFLSISFHVSYLTYLVSKNFSIVFTKHFIVSIVVLSPF